MWVLGRGINLDSLQRPVCYLANGVQYTDGHFILHQTVINIISNILIRHNFLGVEMRYPEESWKQARKLL